MGPTHPQMIDHPLLSVATGSATTGPYRGASLPRLGVAPGCRDGVVDTCAACAKGRGLR